MTELLLHRDHCTRLLDDLIPSATKSLWLVTADLKDLHVARGRRYIPFLQVLAELIASGVQIRLIHAKEPGPRFRADFDKFPELISHPRFARALCPRVHIKAIIIDGHTAYLGSANLTGAGLGAKSPLRRNFEAGVLTTDPALLTPLLTEIREIWKGTHCRRCGLRKLCPDPIA